MGKYGSGKTGNLAYFMHYIIKNGLDADHTVLGKKHFIWEKSALFPEQKLNNHYTLFYMCFLYRRIQVGENPYSRIFYAVRIMKNSWVFISRITKLFH